MSLITKLNRLTVLRHTFNSAPKVVRCISTSPKKSDTATISTTEKVQEQTSSKNKDWVYWGFEAESKSDDSNAMKSSFFFSVTLCIVGGTFIYSYQPDFLMRDWAQREAYLELRRREAAGVDLISPDYIDVATIELPSDEELGKTEIII